MVRQSSSSDVFQAMACPTRRKLLRLLAEGRRPVGELVDELNIRQPSVSEQLGVLRQAGLVRVERVGRSRVYSIAPGGFRPLVDWMREFSQFWDVKLDSLASFLNRQKGDRS